MGPSGLSRYTSDLPLALTPVLRVCPFGNRTQKKTGRRDGVHFAFDNIANGLKSWLTSLTK